MANVLRRHSLLRTALRHRSSQQVQHTCQLSNAEVREKRCTLFDEEKQRQFSLIRRVEKIQVQHKGPPEEGTLIMNKGLSTPFNCAMHIHELLMTRSALALVNGEPWDMHRPLEEDCEIKFLHFKDENTHLANSAYWRTCAFILGHIAETTFKDEHYVELCSFPSPDVRSGKFVHDVDLKLEDWRPTEAELRCLGRPVTRLAAEDHRVHRLDVDAALALRMFEDNRYKSAQIPQIAARSRGGATVPLYRAGPHVDISHGPLLASLGLIGQFAVAAVHQIETSEREKIYRFQGVSLPKQTWAHFWTFDLLRKRAAKLSDLPIIHDHRQAPSALRSRLET